jgi:hypothetical protein
MFLLANKFLLPPDPEMRSLSELVGFSETQGVAWHLKLHSTSIPVDERYLEPDHVAFGVDCRNLQFAVVDWRGLRGASVEVPEQSSGSTPFRSSELYCLNMRTESRWSAVESMTLEPSEVLKCFILHREVRT